MSENSLVPKDKREVGFMTGRAPLPQTIKSRADLPPGEVIKDNSPGISADDRTKFVCYIPNALQHSTHQQNQHTKENLGKDDKKSSTKKTEKKVWLLLTAEAITQGKGNWLFSIIDLLRKDGMVVVNRVVSPQNVISSLLEDLSSGDGSNLNVTGGGQARSGELGRYFEDMIGHCLRERVSDIHIEKRKSNSIIRIRKHGDMTAYDRDISNEKAENLSRVIYDIFASDKSIVFRDDEFQVASIDWNARGESVKLRYQSLPTYLGGFDVVLRVLPIGTDVEVITPLDKLGYSPQQVKALLEIAGRPHGALIIAGTTGSGKSTTLKNLLMYINSSREYRCKIYTIEDPPEYRIPFVSQIPVNRSQSDQDGRAGKSAFSEPLKAVMRGDPDILMLGEIRDKETGDGLQKATQSGHQVLSTIHATRSLGIPARLENFGLERALLGSPDFLTGLVYQRLLPVLCPHCSLSFRDVVTSSNCTENDSALAKRLQEVTDFEDDIRVRNPGGCEKCNYMSIVDRTVCAEIISPDLKMLSAIEKSDTKLAEYHWLQKSDHDRDSENMTGKTVLEHALYKMRKGIVSPYDVESTLGAVNDSEHRRKELADLIGKQFADPNSDTFPSL